MGGDIWHWIIVYLHNLITRFENSILACRTIFWNLRNKNSLQETNRKTFYSKLLLVSTLHFLHILVTSLAAISQNTQPISLQFSFWLPFFLSMTSRINIITQFFHQPHHFQCRELNLFHRQCWFQDLYYSGESYTQSARKKTKTQVSNKPLEGFLSFSKRRVCVNTN